MHFSVERPWPGNQLKDGHAIARAEYRGVTDFRDDGGHLAGAKFTNPARVQPVFIAERQVIEQVLDGGDVLLRQPLGNARAYALNEFDFCMKIQHSEDDT